MAGTEAVLKVAATDRGCCIRVEGKGTMQESQAARDVAQRTLESDRNATVVFDLTECEYLDSTFLGSLLDLWRRYGKCEPPRYLVAAEGERRQRLLGPCRIDRLLAVVESAPHVCGNWITVPTASPDPRQLLRHVMECHRALAQVEGPMQATFARIADQIQKDLPAGGDAR